MPQPGLQDLLGAWDYKLGCACRQVSVFQLSTYIGAIHEWEPAYAYSGMFVVVRETLRCEF